MASMIDMFKSHESITALRSKNLIYNDEDCKTQEADRLVSKFG